MGEDFLIIDRQRYVPGVGTLDLLCVDPTGRLVIIELKRDRSPREAVAQALDYASWLDSISEEQLHENVSQFLKRPFADVFLEHFHKKVPAIAPQNHRVILVASRLDSAAERIINYLSERHGVDINAVFFKYAKLQNQHEILVRSVLVSDEVRKTQVSGGYQRSQTELLAMATERQTTALVEICRRMNTVWEEEGTAGYGGSFRYWAETPTGKSKVVFGINVSGKRLDAPAGQLDVWIAAASLAEVTGVSEKEIRLKLEHDRQRNPPQQIDYVIRLESPDQAEKLVKQLQAWASNKREKAVATS